ncbi:MAG: DNA polymerase III subunit gamma/tau [Planctomycetaceae bacterium]
MDDPSGGDRGDGDRTAAPAVRDGAAAYRVVARRYRPQRFAELVGQEHVARGLAGAIESGRVGHAYLFTGGRGVGKTSAARILAKALECQRGPAPEPCDTCDACRAIAGGQDIDVVEIDAASNRGIDEIRQLRQNVAVRPARGRYKVYIIDEVHMLTREAFNALLKTLEEPPPHVKFVLCTTEPDKLPVTILSRCQRFDFHVVDATAIAGRLHQIAAAEGVAITPDAIRLVARRANGSMRDSQSLLEQLIGGADATGAAPIGVEDVHAVIGTGREELIGALLGAVVDRDARAALAALDAALAGGADAGGILEQMLAALRDCLVASVGCGPEALRGGDGLGIDLAELGRRLGTATTLAMLQIVDGALGRMRTSAHAGVLAEMAVVRLATLEDLDGLAGLVDQVVRAGVPPASGGGAGSGPVARPLPPREKKTTERSAATDRPLNGVAGGFSVAEDRATLAEDRATVAEDRPTAVVSAVDPAGDPLAVWRECGRIVGGLVADFADLAVRAVWRDGLLEVALPADSAATATPFLGRPDVITALQAQLTALVGRPARLAFGVDSPPPADPTPHDKAAAGAPARPPAGRGGQSVAALVREATGHPLVARARELFDAAIVRVDPPRERRTAAPVGTATAGPGASAATDDSGVDEVADG